MIEKKKVGYEAKADDCYAVLDEDPIQANKSPGAQEAGPKLDGGDEDDDSKVSRQLCCCHAQLQPPAIRLPDPNWSPLKRTFLD